MSGDYVERLRAWRAFASQNRPGYDHMRGVSYDKAPVCDADLDAALDELEQLRAERAELEAVLAEGNQRDRALALLLLRNGGQVEFTLTERVTAPQDGELISYPNAVTGGLVLAYQPADAAPQQSAREGAT